MGSEEQRIVVTTDKDFEQIIWLQQAQHCGILRLENLPHQERMALLESALQNHGQDLQAGRIVIAMQHKFRIREGFSV